MHSEPFEPAGVNWSPVSPRLATARRISASVFFGVILLVFVLVATLGEQAWAWVFAAATAGFLVYLWIAIGRRVRAIGYAERDEELLVRRGIVWRQLVVVPYGRLQFVDVQAGPLDRALGIATVQLHTASAGTDATIPGLPPDEAARLRDRLTERGQSRLAGL